MSLTLTTGTLPLGSTAYRYDSKFRIHAAVGITTSYTPDYADGNLHAIAISGTVTLADPTNCPIGAPIVLVVNNALGGSIVTSNANTLVDTDETGIYEIVVTKVYDGVFYYTKGAELFL